MFGEIWKGKILQNKCSRGAELSASDKYGVLCYRKEWCLCFVPDWLGLVSGLWGTWKRGLLGFLLQCLKVNPHMEADVLQWECQSSAVNIPLALYPCTGCHCFSSSFGKVFSVELKKAVFIFSTQLRIVPGTCPLSFRRVFSQTTLFHLQHFLGQIIWKHWTSGLSMGSIPGRCFRVAFNRDLKPWVTPVVNGHRDRAMSQPFHFPGAGPITSIQDLRIQRWMGPGFAALHSRRGLQNLDMSISRFSSPTHC